MLAFGRRLGEDAVGLFASDKPAGDAINENGLTPAGRALLDRANAAYRERFGTAMTAAALAGFSGAWALVHDVLPNATAISPDAIASAALKVDLPTGALPNGSGLRFGAPGTANAGANLRAESVIWEWTEPGERWIVWPERYATYEIETLDPLP